MAQAQTRPKNLQFFQLKYAHYNRGIRNCLWPQLNHFLALSKEEGSTQKSGYARYSSLLSAK